MQSESETQQQPQPLAIFLPYRQSPLISKLLLDVHKHLLNNKPPSVIVKVDGLKDSRYYYEIAGVKKLFECAIEKGLIGLLSYHGHEIVCKQVYAIAYLKSKMIKRTDDGVMKFDINVKNYTNILRASQQAFNKLLTDDSGGTTTFRTDINVNSSQGGVDTEHTEDSTGLERGNTDAQTVSPGTDAC
jgi:hypothetical protein